MTLTVAGVRTRGVDGYEVLGPDVEVERDREAKGTLGVCAFAMLCKHARHVFTG